MPPQHYQRVLRTRTMALQGGSSCSTLLGASECSFEPTGWTFKLSQTGSGGRRTGWEMVFGLKADHISIRASRQLELTLPTHIKSGSKRLWLALEKLDLMTNQTLHKIGPIFPRHTPFHKLRLPLRITAPRWMGRIPDSIISPTSSAVTYRVEGEVDVI